MKETELTEKPRLLNLRFGGLAPKISTQLKQQGFEFDKQTVLLFEKLLDSILYLMFNDFLTDKQIDKMYDKLRRKIIAHIKQKNKLN